MFGRSTRKVQRARVANGLGAHGPTRLGLEMLDARLTPAAYTWAGLGQTQAWTDQGNWAPAGVPGANDDATFDGSLGAASSVQHVVVNAQVVKKLTVTPGYLGRIKIAQGGGLTVVHQVVAEGAKFSTVQGGVQAPGSLWIQGAGSEFKQTEFDYIAVRIAHPQSQTATTTLTGFIRLLNDSSVEVAQGSELNWQAGDIETTGTAHVKNTGKMRINSSGVISDYTSGTVDRLKNDGELTFYSSPYIYGNFTTSSSLIVESTASPTFRGAAVQINGTTTLRGGIAEIRVINSGTKYEVRKGSIAGTGKVTGNLELSTFFNPQVASISPGIGDGATKIGTLTITGDLVMNSPSTAANIQFTETGAVDKIVVGGVALLDGTLTISTSDLDPANKPKYKPARGTKMVFLTAASFYSDFVVKNVPSWGSWLGADGLSNVWKLKKDPTEYYLLADALGGS